MEQQVEDEKKKEDETVSVQRVLGSSRHLNVRGLLGCKRRGDSRYACLRHILDRQTGPTGLLLPYMT